MTELENLVKNLFIIIISVSFLEILLPSSSMSKYVKFVFSLTVMAIILSPLSKLLA